MIIRSASNEKRRRVPHAPVLRLGFFCSCGSVPPIFHQESGEAPMMPRLFLRIAFTLTLLMSCAGGARAQSFSQIHAKVELVAQDAALKPGGTATIGVLFDLDKGWHTYWVNPGDSGAPTRFKWTLPAGFSVGNIRWPVPIRIGTGSVVDYGYQGRLLLTLPLQVPANYVPGKPINLASEIHFLVCSDVCIPATATPKLTIPGNDAVRPQLFASSGQRYPETLPAGWKITAADQGKNFVLNVETGARETQAAFFPLDEDVVDNATLPVVAPAEHGAKITLKKSDLLTKPAAKLNGILVTGGHAVEVSAPLAPGR
jgi:DsbC/DsbD-like thiol-disulfide interchange protein